MNTRKAEQIAIDAVKRYFNGTELIAPYLSDNDKKPEWDGELLVYSSYEECNEHLVGRIPVQVKSRQCKAFKDNELSYSISVVSLTNYMRDGGIVFFVVQIREDTSTKIFYCELAPIKIKGILNHKKGLKGVSVKFKPLEEDFHYVENRLKDFCYDCKYQKSFADTPIMSYKELQKVGYNKLHFHRTGKGKFNILKSIQEEPIFLYAENEVGALYPIGDDKYTIQVTHPQGIITVKHNFGIGKEVISNYYTKEYKEEKLICRFPNCMTIEISFDKEGEARSEKYIFSATADKLSERIAQMENIIKLLTIRKYFVNEVSYNLPAMDVNMGNIQQNLKDLKMLKDMLEKLGVYKDLDMSNLSDDDERNINILIHSVGNGELLDLKNPQSWLCLRLSNLRLFLYIEQVKGLCKITSVFDANIVVGVARNDGEKPRPSSIFTILSKEGYLIYDNIPYERIVDTYKEMIPYNPYLFERANWDLLTILLAVDELKAQNDYRYKRTLGAAMALSKWLLDVAIRSETVPDEMLRINYLQVVYRARALNSEERKQLIGITAKSEVPNSMKVGAYLLLGDKDSFDFHFDHLTNEERNNFKTYPIYNLYGQLQ